ncbi:MAG TPA: GPW/gp25 family protein [Bryobacteraceae bacterium]|nr:GPW/gp25 family protein [Bryobacteraceae bacterium]
MPDNADQGKDFLGAGLAFPLAVDGEGRLAMNSYEDHIRQSILLIARTGKSERVMQPDFGAGLESQVFAPANVATTALVEHQVKDALIRYEPRIEVLSVKATIDPAEYNRLNVEVQYRVRRTDTTFNLVYPFYLDRGQL